jgi:prefoldin subunit 5
METMDGDNDRMAAEAMVNAAQRMEELAAAMTGQVDAFQTSRDDVLRSVSECRQQVQRLEDRVLGRNGEGLMGQQIQTRTLVQQLCNDFAGFKRGVERIDQDIDKLAERHTELTGTVRAQGGQISVLNKQRRGDMGRVWTIVMVLVTAVANFFIGLFIGKG